MFCKATQIKVSPKDVNKLNEYMDEQWAPLIFRQEGLRGAYYMRKAEGEALVIMLWETDAQMQAWDDNPEHKKIADEIKSIFTSLVADYYVVHHTIVA